MAIRAKFVGDVQSKFVNGVPARDLTEEEYDALSTEQRKLVRETGAYEVAPERVVAERRSSSDDDSDRDTKRK